MSKVVRKDIIVRIPVTPEYSAGWMLDALANGAHKGLMMAKKGLATYTAEAFQILDGKHPQYVDPNAEQAQARLSKLDDFCDERECQIVDFETVRDHAAAEYYNIKGMPWTPYEAKSATLKTNKSKTAVNESWAKRAKAATA